MALFRRQAFGLLRKIDFEGAARGGRAVLGKVACGLVLCVGFCIAVAIVGLLLKLIQKAVAQVAVLRFIDGVLSTLLMMALGAVIWCLAHGRALYPSALRHLRGKQAVRDKFFAVARLLCRV